MIGGLINETALKYNLRPEIVGAVIWQESRGETFAYRGEEAYLARYKATKPLTEAMALSMSWGLMQVMGATARDMGLKGWLSKLCDPAVGVEYGTRYLKSMLDKEGGDYTKALARYNAGVNKDGSPRQAGLEYAKLVLGHVESGIWKKLIN